MRRSKRPEKIHCEVCFDKNKATLQLHHIIERTEIDTTNDWDNLCCICANCHLKVHDGEINIIGVLPSTHPTGRSLVYARKGVKNIDIDIPKLHKIKGTKL